MTLPLYAVYTVFPLAGTSTFQVRQVVHPMYPHLLRLLAFGLFIVGRQDCNAPDNGCRYRGRWIHGSGQCSGRPTGEGAFRVRFNENHDISNPRTTLPRFQARTKYLVLTF